ncbi:tyrosine-type recombinase/integrase [Pseudobacteroides cellulosolvens]|uniref:Integrase family protein n=1 Tax=Pseudobacteroides cellulosolvens ATCC 35603 = DSM 2933 TaxID=398512 RepID=A0A0L6JQN5_9FIRM|nr:site-specific integrase [Pseudobacteroides cellulosolvens]KNY27677.1 integrase family protein [Pseudobacteroides cellulosolvens ATCC 35603 = DSM 2933]
MSDYLKQNTSQKEKNEFWPQIVRDSIEFWMEYYLQMTIIGVRSEGIEKKIRMHLGRFNNYFVNIYGHDRISACVKRDVLEWQISMKESDLAHSTINNHLAHLSGFFSWVETKSPGTLAAGNPCKGVSELGLPPLEPRALSEEQIRSLKNVCDRLDRFHQLKGRRHAKFDTSKVHNLRRPLRDRAIVFTLLCTGLRREELVKVNLSQVSPCTPDELRNSRKAKIDRVQGKGKTERVVFLSNDARMALADYIEKERIHDTLEDSTKLFLSAKDIPVRKADGSMSPRSINDILKQIGQWHDSEMKDPSRRISPLCPHALRHTFAFQLSKITGADAYELERRLGHRSQRYIQRYTNPPEDIAAGYVEEL